MGSNSGTHLHVLPLRVYLGVGISLLVMTIATVLVSYVHLGGWNVVVAIGIATFKAILVALFFMHLLYDNKFYLFVFSMGVLFLGVFITLTMFDTMTRDAIYEFRAKPIASRAIIYTDTLGNTGAHTAGGGTDSTAHESGH